MMSRRKFLRLAGLAAGATAIGGCARTDDGGAVTEQDGSNAASSDSAPEGDAGTVTNPETEAAVDAPFERADASTLISNVIEHPLFEGFGRLMFPVTFSAPTPQMTLADLPQCLPWYSEIRTETTVDVVNELLARRTAGQQVFYDIYSDAEKAADPSLEDTGLFFFQAEEAAASAPFAVVCAGGGFAYVASMHDSFPHALHLSRSGVNGFALQYRPDAQLACEDLSRAVSCIFQHADELGVDVEGYSLWGGSAGARMAAYVGEWGPAAFGGDDVPQPAAVVMQYTGHRQTSGSDPATYACVGTRDGIADWRSMQARIRALDAQGVPAEFHAYEGLRHGFGLGIGTVAEGWIDDALAFWMKNRPA